MFKVGDHGYGFHNDGKNYHTFEDKDSYHTFDNKFYVEDSLNVRKDIGWNSGNTWNSKGKLTSDNNGTNIELHNNNNKPGLMLYANSENKGSRLKMNDKDGNFINEMWRNKPNTQKVRFIQISNIGKAYTHDYMQIMEVQALKLDGTNVAKDKPVSIIAKEPASIRDSTTGTKLSNITNDKYENNDSTSQYWHEEGGKYKIQIDLGAEHDLSQITIFNRYNASYDKRLDNVELTLLDENKNVVKRYQTGKWHRQYSKEFML